MFWNAADACFRTAIMALATPFLATAWLYVKFSEARERHAIASEFAGDRNAYNRARWYREAL